MTRADTDWHAPENLSRPTGQLAGTAGQVLWACGTHDIHEIAKIGLAALAFLEANKA